MIIFIRNMLAFLAVSLACSTAANAADAPRYATAADGAKIAFYAPEKYEGIPVLVLSGGPGTDSRYMRVGGALDRLGQERPLIFFDQRGTSRSSASNGGESIAQYIGDLEAIRKAVGAERLDVLGHSFGGYLAIAYTAAFSDRVRSVVLIDSAPPKLSDLTQLLPDVYPDRIEAWRKKRATLGLNNPSSESAIFMSMEFVTDEAFRDYLSAVAAHRDNIVANNALRRDMAKLDYWPSVRQFKQPTLVIHGRFDAVVAPSNSWRLHQAMNNSEFRIIESAGHLPHIERPDAFLEIVRPFFAELDASERDTDQKR